jgi:hypothetical protein
MKSRKASDGNAEMRKSGKAEMDFRISGFQRFSISGGQFRLSTFNFVLWAFCNFSFLVCLL